MTLQDRNEKIEQYGNAYNEISEFLKGLSKEELEYKPAPEKWSAHEIVVHIADSEANSYVRVRKALAEPGGMVFGYDQDVWTQKLDYSKLNFDDYLELFRLLRKTTYDLIKNLPEEKWQNHYNHSEYGPAGLEKWLEIYAKHIPGHIAQIKRNLEAMKTLAI